MSDVFERTGMVASVDGKWYPPEQQPNYEAAAPPPSPTPSPSPARSSAGSFKFEMNRWSQAERITAIATLVLLISLFLPWLHVPVLSRFSLRGRTLARVDVPRSVAEFGDPGDLIAKASFSTMPFKLPLPEEADPVVRYGNQRRVDGDCLPLEARWIRVQRHWLGLRFLRGLIAAIVAAFPTAAPAIKGTPYVTHAVEHAVRTTS